MYSFLPGAFDGCWTMSPRTIDDPTAAAVSGLIGLSVCAMTPAVKSECMLSIGKNLLRVLMANLAIGGNSL